LRETDIRECERNRGRRDEADHGYPRARGHGLVWKHLKIDDEMKERRMRYINRVRNHSQALARYVTATDAIPSSKIEGRLVPAGALRRRRETKR